MATDYREMEREFVDGLTADTGKDLAQWMLAIDTSGLTERNAIIDWLRLQGFQFSWASWLQRIHHNGGRLIYDDGAEPAADPAAERVADAAPDERRVEKRAEEKRAAPAEIKRPTPTLVVDANGGIARLLQDAKGLKPLAELVLRDICRSVAGARLAPSPPLIVASAPAPFIALLPHPKKLRVYADFAADALPGLVRAPDAQLKGPAPFSGMILLDDARLVDEAFLAAVRGAAAMVAAR